MKKRLMTGLIMSVMVLTSAAEPLRAVKCEQPPKMDGKLDDPCWRNAVKFSDFKILNSGAPAFPAEAYLLYGDKALYVGFKLSIPDGGVLKADARKGGKTGVYSDDCVEVMVDPNATGTRYFHFLVNANGALQSLVWDQGGYVNQPCETNASAVGFAGQGFWSCEVSIPFSSLDIHQEGRTWAFNFAHGARKPYQDSSIADMGIFHNAAKFIPIKDFQIDSARYAWELSAPEIVTRKDDGEISVDVTAEIGNSASVSQQATFNLVMIGNADDGSPAGIGGSSVTETFAGKSRRRIQFPKISVKKPGDFRCILSVTDPETRHLLKRRTFTRKIAYEPFIIKIKRPLYRNMIFSSQKLKEVVYSISSALPAKDLAGAVVTTGIRDEKGMILCERKINSLTESISFPAESLPETEMSVFVRAVSGNRVLGEASHPLRKLPFKAGEVWRDEHGIWHVEDRPFFLIGSWGANYIPGVNATVGDFKIPGVLRLDRNIVYEPRFVALTKVPVISREDCAYLAEIYEKMAKIQNLFAHYIVDEPEISGCTVMALKQNADIAREVDPYHPLVCSNDTVDGLKNFSGCAEINGLHPYPPPRKDNPRNEFRRIVLYLDQAVAFGKTQADPQTIAFLQQGFNYGDCGAANTRVPTFDEARTQYLISLAMGGNGILFFNFCTEHYYEFSVGHPEIAREMVALTPAMTVPDENSPAIKTDNENIRFRVKKVGTEYWIIACSTEEAPQKAVFMVPGLGNRKLHVFRENRSLNVRNGSFSDSFKNYDARVYTTDQRDFGLRPLAEVEAEIVRLNESRRKSGNLAFQMYEHDLLKIYASSNLNDDRTPDCILWHVTDGITGGKAARHGNDKGKLAWCDKTPNKTPDWIVLEFPKPVRIGRVVVYPAEGTLKDYEVQVEVNGKFQTVGSAKNLKPVWGEHQEFRFDPVLTSKVRLFVTADNGPDTKVHEIEVYEK